MSDTQFSLWGEKLYLIGSGVVLKFSSPTHLLNSAWMMPEALMTHISGKDRTTDESISKL